jgi:hypothetical protein
MTGGEKILNFFPVKQIDMHFFQKDFPKRFLGVFELPLPLVEKRTKTP